MSITDTQHPTFIDSVSEQFGIKSTSRADAVVCHNKTLQVNAHTDKDLNTIFTEYVHFMFTWIERVAYKPLFYIQCTMGI